MKNSILCCFAAIALALSYFYEVSPTPADSNSQNPVVQPTTLVPLAPETDPKNPYFATLALPEPEVVAAPAPKIAKITKKAAAKKQKKALPGVNIPATEKPELIASIRQWLGTPYRSGSSTKRGTDCSGFVTRIYQDVYGINLSRSSHTMFQHVQPVKKDSMRTGDLVFFRRSPKQPIYHVGIYLKGGKFVHSATNGGVMISSLKQPYYQRNFYAAGRVN